MSNANTVPQARRRTRVWRWVFLCSQAALPTLLALLTVDLHRFHTASETSSRTYHLQHAVLHGGFLLLECFLLSASPCFFRRLGRVALTAWVGALAALVWMFVPVP